MDFDANDDNDKLLLMGVAIKCAGIYYYKL
jgi:hypothetical protein